MLRLQKGRLFALLSLCVLLPLFALSCKNFVNSQHFHTVTISSSITGGEIRVKKSMFSVGETVNLIITPNEDYSLRKGSLYYIAGKNRVLIPGGSFIMPGSDITVFGNFDNDYNIMATLNLTSANFVDKMYLKCSYFTGGNPNPPPLKWTISDENVAVFDGEPELMQDESDANTLVYRVCLKTPDIPLYFQKSRVTVTTENNQSSSTCEISAIPNHFITNNLDGDPSDGGECWIVGINTSKAMECVQSMSFRIPDYIKGFKVTRIGEGAFERFTDSTTGITANVTELIIPGSVVSIGANAFYAFLPESSSGTAEGNFGCLNVTVLASTPPEIALHSKIFNDEFNRRAANNPSSNPMSFLKITVANNSELYRTSWADWSKYIIGMNEYQIFVTVNPELSNGTAYSKKASAALGDFVDIICDPDPGYQLQPGSVRLYKTAEFTGPWEEVTTEPYNRFVMKAYTVYVVVSFIPIPDNFDTKFKVSGLSGSGVEYIEDTTYYYEFDSSNISTGAWNQNKLTVYCKTKLNYEIAGVFFAERGKLTSDEINNKNDLEQYKNNDETWTPAAKNEGTTGSYTLEIPSNSFMEIHIFVRAITSLLELYDTKYGQYSHIAGANDENPPRGSVLYTLSVKGDSKAGTILSSVSLSGTSETNRIGNDTWASMAEITTDRKRRVFAGFVTEENVLVPIKDTEEDRKKLVLRFVRDLGDAGNHSLQLTSQWNTEKSGTVKLYAKYYEPPLDISDSIAPNHYINLDMNGGWFRKDDLVNKPLVSGILQKTVDQYNLPSSTWVSAGSFNTPNEPDNDRFSYTYKLRGALYDEPLPQTVSMYKTDESGNEELKIFDIPYTSSATVGETLFAPVRPGFRFMGFFNFPQSRTKTDGESYSCEGFDSTSGKYLTGTAAETAMYKFYSQEADVAEAVLEATKQRVTSEGSSPLMYLNSNMEVVGSGISPYNGTDLTIYAWWEEDVLEATDSAYTIPAIHPQVTTENGVSVLEYELWSFRDLISVSLHSLGATDESTKFTIMRNLKMHPTSIMPAIKALKSQFINQGFCTPVPNAYAHKPTPLYGKLDGQNYQLDNIYVHTASSNSPVGILSQLYGCVQNLVINSGHVIHTDPSGYNTLAPVGGLVGSLIGGKSTHDVLVDNVYNRGVTVTGCGITGGLFGTMTSGATTGNNAPTAKTLRRCGNTAEIQTIDPPLVVNGTNIAPTYVGGVWGQLIIAPANQTMEYCFNEGTIRLIQTNPAEQGSIKISMNMGGIAGRVDLYGNNFTIRGLYNNGEITGCEKVEEFVSTEANFLDYTYAFKGGLIGMIHRHKLYQINVMYCYNTVDLKCTYPAGLFHSESNSQEVASTTDLYIENCYNSGVIHCVNSFPSGAALVSMRGAPTNLQLHNSYYTLAQNNNGSTYTEAQKKPSGSETTTTSGSETTTEVLVHTQTMYGPSQGQYYSTSPTRMMFSALAINGRPTGFNNSGTTWDNKAGTTAFSNSSNTGVGWEVVNKNGQPTLQIRGMHETGSDS